MAWNEVETSTLAPSGTAIHGEQGALLASASTVALTDTYHQISGTTQVNNFTYSGAQPALFVIRPTGALPIGSSGNISPITTTAVANKHLMYWYDGTTFYEIPGNYPALTAGKISDAVLSANVPLMTAGKIPDADLSANVPLLNAGNVFSVANTFSAGVSLGATSTISTGGLTLSGATTGVVKERGRTAAMGEWTAVGSPTISGLTGGTITVRYMLIGKTMWINVSVNGSTASAVGFGITVPGGFSAATVVATHQWASAFEFTNNAVLGTGLIRIPSGASTIDLLKDINGTSFAAGATALAASLAFEVA